MYIQYSRTVVLYEVTYKPWCWLRV